MSEKEIFKMTGDIIECLPNATFKVKLSDTGHVIFATISGKIRKFNINIALGDRVDVELTPYDLNRGRIMFRYK